jgi:DNA-binding MarR family transcriptional regulator
MGKHYHFFKVPHETVSEEKFKKLNASSKALFMTLCRLANLYADTDGWFFRSMRDLANDSGIHLQTVVNAKKELIKSNYVCHKRGKYESTNYRASDCYKINGFKLKVFK